jgi:hypothetical protein
MANTIFQLRRNAVSGTRPTTSTVSEGELAINTTDGILFSANATSVFEIGSNNTNIAVGNSSSRFIVNTTAVAISNSQGLIANGSFGTANQVLASNGSGVYWTTAGAGSASASVRQTFTANATVNTTFTVSGGYTVGYVDVYKNGVKLINGTDVTVTNGSTVVLTNAAVSNDIIDVVGYVAGVIPIVNNSVSVRQTFTANATVNTTFTVSGGYTAGFIDVYYNGAKLVNSSDVQANNGSTIVLSSAAPSGTIIDVVGLTGGTIISVNTGLQYYWTNTHTYQSNAEFQSNVTIASTGKLIITNGAGIYANGTLGSTGQFLTSDGANVYWSTFAVNTQAQYIWSNNQTYNANVTIASTGELIISNGAGIYANGTLGINNQVLTSNGVGISWSAKSIMSYRTVTSNTTVLATDDLIIANGTLTVTLPAASTVSGQQFYVKNINNSNGIITVLPNGSELIDGYANATIRYYNTMFGVISIGTGWVIF